MSTKLSQQTLATIKSVQKPKYNRQDITPGIVHIGIGGFHRAHQAVYTDDLLASGAHQWGITAVSLRSDSVYQALAPQDFLYTVNTQAEDGGSKRLISSICEVIALTQPGAHEKIVAIIADPSTQVITLTITEKGYCHQVDGELDSTNPSIVHDLQNPGQPQSAPGLLALALKRRMETKAGPITLLSCDNLSNNGEVLHNVVATMMQEQYPTAVGWLANNVSFPSSMVDRIVPQTKVSDIEQLEKEAGYLDSGLVVCEPFSQWVIEDNFAGLRPAWDVGGAEFVAEVAPYEQTKLRFLNATHSALAYLGLLAGYTDVHKAIADPTLANFARQLMDIEIEPVVVCPNELDLEVYKNSILTRFANAAVPYKTAQVASDGSQKLPQRIFPTIQAQLSNGGHAPGLCLVVAGWLHCLTNQQSAGGLIDIKDPQAKTIVALASASLQTRDLVRTLAETTHYFGVLGQNAEFLESVTDGITNLKQSGSLATVAKLL